MEEEHDNTVNKEKRVCVVYKIHMGTFDALCCCVTRDARGINVLLRGTWRAYRALKHTEH